MPWRWAPWLSVGLAGCGEDAASPDTAASADTGSSSSTGTTAAGSTPRVPAEVPTTDPNPDDLVDAIDNPYLPYVPGTRRVYVWYFGEDTTAYDDGKSTKEGSWKAGVDGAQAGIVMLADPRPGDQYLQEYYKGEAE